jgi:hypothetical protein
MVIITRTRDVFVFDELSYEAQQNALGVLAQDAWENLDSADVSDSLAGVFLTWATGEPQYGEITAKQLTEQYGVRIYWSVGYVQSDHAAIEGKLHRFDLPKLSWPDGVTFARVHSTNLGNSRVELVETEDDTLYHGELFDATVEMITELNGDLYRQARDHCESMADPDYMLELIGDHLPRRFTAEGQFAPYEYWSDDTEAV